MKMCKKHLKELVKLPDSKIEIDTSDIPEVKDWSKAERSKFYRIKTAIWVDPMGSMSETPEGQVQRCTEVYAEELGVKLDVHMQSHVGGIEVGTDLVLFDYGGMMLGNNLAEDNSRDLLQWAEDHPSSLVVIISDFTYDRAFRYAIEEHLGLENVASSYQKPEGERHKTPIHNIVVEHCQEHFIPQWFRDAHGCIADDWKRTTGEVVTTLPEPDITSIDTSDFPPASYIAKLPDQKFFKPKKSFLTFMAKKFAKQNIFDVGAGIGHVAEALSKTKKFGKVLAIDMFGRNGD